jgi:hypothetical protein
MDMQRKCQRSSSAEVLREPWLRCEHRYAGGALCRKTFRERWVHRSTRGRSRGQLIAPGCRHMLQDAVYIDRETHRRLRGYAE